VPDPLPDALPVSKDVPGAGTAAGSVTGGEGRVLTVPNAITLARLLCLPFYLVLLLGHDDRAAAALVLAGLGATDWVDGYVARRFHQVSELGKILDPVADRLLFFVGVGGIMLIDPPGAPLWFCGLVIAREVFVSVATLALAALGARRIDVTWVGKAGTFFLMFAFPLLLIGSSTLSSAPIFRALGWMTGMPGLVLGYVAAVRYVPIGLAALREGRAARSRSTTR
jgi:cardiolipin synthase